MNRYGYFDDARREYVITRPDTPQPWINYLGCERFFGIISNTAGGYSFYMDARLRRLTRYRYNNVPIDTGGRYLYIREGDLIWNPGWKPCRTELDRYSCRHGLGYTVISGEKNSLQAELTFFVPPGEDMEIWALRLRNLGGLPKKVQLFSFVEFCLWDALDDMINFQRNYNTGEVEVEGSVIFHKTEYRERRSHYAYFACSEEIDGFDTCRDSFIGLHRGFADPAAVLAGRCGGSIASGGAPVGAHQLNLFLEPGEEKRLHFALGYMENPEEHKFSAPGVINKERFAEKWRLYRDPAVIERDRRRLGEFWSGLLARFQVELEEEHLSRMVNTWNQYQCFVAFNLSRSASFFESGIKRGIGFRDSNQDLLGAVHMVPERARQRLLDLAAVQFADGSCYHQFQPLTKQGNREIGGGFNDDPLWLVLSTCALIKETGDLSVLEEKAPFADAPESGATLYDHLLASMRFSLNNLGPHRLPLIGRADWNDCLNLNSFSRNPDESFQTAATVEESVAESVMLAGLFLYACRELQPLLEKLGDAAALEELVRGYALVREAVEKHGWDGEWFLRAYDYFGAKVGSRECAEGQIFIESQGWCIMGGAGLEDGRAWKALESVARRLATPQGIILQQPAYSRYYQRLGEISSYPPGHKENAGIFCHSNPWIIIAETMAGSPERAYDYYRRICPSLKQGDVETYRCEPYCYAQVITGRDAARPGEARNSWLTGTAAWSFVAVTQHILGIKPDYDGLRIEPRIPGHWKGYRATRYFRGAVYRIAVQKRGAGAAEVRQVKVNGEPIQGTLIPFDPAHRETGGVEVEVTLE